MITHYNAVKDRLEDASALSDKVFDSARLNADGTFVRANYIILFGGSPAELGGDRQFRQQVADDNAVFDFTLRGVGTSATAARSMLMAAATQLVGWVPQISGRYCRPVRFTGGDDPRPDMSVKPPLFFADDEYELRSFFRGTA